MLRPTDRTHAAPVSAAAPVAFEIDLSQMLKTLWRRRALIVLCVLICGSAAWAAVSRIEPVYTATSSVMLDLRRQRVADIREVLSQLAPQQVTVLSEVEVIKSRGLAQRVADKLDLYSDPEFNAALRRPDENPDAVSLVAGLAARAVDALFPSEEREPPDPATLAERQRSAVVGAVMGRLSANAVPLSLVIRISFASTDPRKAALIANAFADAYINEQLEAKFEALRRGTAWLNDRLETLRQSVLASESAVASYRSSIGLIENRGVQINNQRLQELNSQIILVQSRRAEQEARVSRLETMIRDNRSLAAVDELLDTPLLQRFKEQEALLVKENAELLQRYGTNHPAITKSNAELAAIRTTITVEVRKQAQALRGELAVLREREAGLVRQSQQLESAVLRQTTAEVRLRELEREAQANRTLYETFLGRFKETGEQENIQQSDSRVISLAQTPRAPSFPRVRLIVVGAMLAGLVAGVALVLVIERFDDAFRTREQLETAAGYPVIGMIPQVASLPGQRVENRLVERPASSFAEAFRITWFGLKHARSNGELGAILVTSSVPEESKSLTSLSLARTAANLSKSVLLIDMDLRRSSVSRMLGIKPVKGLTDILRGDVSLEEAVVRDPLAKVDVVFARGSAQTQVDIANYAGALAQLLRDAKQRYDIVVIDCPPTMPVADVQVIAPLADTAVFCVRWNSTPRASVHDSLRTLVAAGAPIAGLLLTRVNVRKHASYGYGDVGHYYGKYRGYYGS